MQRIKVWDYAQPPTYIEYGHELTCNLMRAQADSLLRADLIKHPYTICHFGKYTMLLAVLSYNVCKYRMLGQ